MGAVKKFFDWMTNKPKEKKVYHNLTEEELIKEKGVNEALKREIKNLRKDKATKEAQLGEIKADENEKREKIKKKDIENEAAKKLNEEEKDLNKEKYGRWLSMKKFFFRMYRDKKFYNRFEYADMKDEKSWKFGDIMISTKKYFGAFDRDGKLLVASPCLEGLFYKSESILNQIKRGRILLACDKNGDFIEEIDSEGDLSDYEIPVPTWNEETQKYEKTKDLRKSARDIIIKLQDDLREVRERNKRLDLTIVDLRDENSDLKRANSVLTFSNKSGKSAVSDAISSMFSQGMEMSDITKKISSLTERNVLLEREVDLHKSINSKLLDEIEKTGDQTSVTKAIALMETAREFERSNPSLVNQPENKNQEKNTPTNTSTNK